MPRDAEIQMILREDMYIINIVRPLLFDPTVLENTILLLRGQVLNPDIAWYVLQVFSNHPNLENLWEAFSTFLS